MENISLKCIWKEKQGFLTIFAFCVESIFLMGKNTLTFCVRDFW